MITSQITIGAGMRPCAVCGAYVPATGCEHWKPKKPRTPHRPSPEVVQRRRERHAVSEQQRRERRREAEQIAKENARVAVAAFRAVMTRG